MHYVQLLHAIFSGLWLMEKTELHAYTPIVKALIEGNNEVIAKFNVESKARSNFSIIAPDGSHANTSFNDAPENSLAIIPIQGPLMRADFCGDPGTETMGRWIKAADRSANIDAIILQINSPGGHVDGTEALANIVTATKKPVVNHVKNLMASAAMWIGSGANHTMIEGKTTIVGSIGTKATIRDMKPYLENIGIKEHHINATKSTEKTRIFDDVLEGKYEPIRKEMLDPLNEAFLNHIKTNLANSIDLAKEDVLTGKVYVGQKIIDVGLAHSMGTYDKAIAKAKELSIQYKSDTNMKFLSNLFNKIKKEKGEEPTEEEVANAADEEVAALEKTIEEEKAKVKAESDAKDALAAKIKALETEKADLQAEVKALGEATPKPVTADKKGDKFSEEDEDFLNALDKEAIAEGIEINTKSFVREKSIL